MNNQNHYEIKDKSNKSIIIAWQKMSMVEQAYADVMASVWACARQAYLSVEIDFLKRYPAVVQQEPYFQCVKTLFDQGLAAVDWELVQDAITEQLKQFFVFDVSQLSKEMIAMFAEDSCFIATARDKETHNIIGFITFLVRKNYPDGAIKVMSFAVHPDYQHRGIGKHLMASIFSMNVAVSRIFLCTRVTNEMALKAYTSWGFEFDTDPIMDHHFNKDHWIFLTYDGLKKTLL